MVSVHNLVGSAYCIRDVAYYKLQEFLLLILLSIYHLATPSTVWYEEDIKC